MTDHDSSMLEFKKITHRDMPLIWEFRYLGVSLKGEGENHRLLLCRRFYVG